MFLHHNSLPTIIYVFHEISKNHVLTTHPIFLVSFVSCNRHFCPSSLNDSLLQLQLFVCCLDVTPKWMSEACKSLPSHKWVPRLIPSIPLMLSLLFLRDFCCLSPSISLCPSSGMTPLSTSDMTTLFVVPALGDF